MSGRGLDTVAVTGATEALSTGAMLPELQPANQATARVNVHATAVLQRTRCYPVPGTNGTKLTSARVSSSTPSSLRVSNSNRCAPWGPTGMTMRPPTVS